jgi:hypothetical protein
LPREGIPRHSGDHLLVSLVSPGASGNPEPYKPHHCSRPGANPRA